MVPDVVTGDPRSLYCLNCARRVVSPTTVSKYHGLTSYLRFRGAFTPTVKLSFVKIDGIIGENLPMGAYRSEQWWNNSPAPPHAHCWLDAGWEVQEVNLREGFVVFKKVREMIVRKRSPASEIKKPFTPVRVKIPKPTMPSKTKVSKLYARIKNVERQRKSMPVYHGSLKSKSTYQKKLFKPEEKPR